MGKVRVLGRAANWDNKFPIKGNWDEVNGGLLVVKEFGLLNLVHIEEDSRY